jgi:hypothetical protein
LEPLSCRSGKLIVQVTPITAVSYRKGMAEHTGHSSQLFPVAPGRNAQFLTPIQIGLNISHTDAGSLENDKIWIPLNMAA